jgi:hypothetical protein
MIRKFAREQQYGYHVTPYIEMSEKVKDFEDSIDITEARLNTLLVKTKHLTFRTASLKKTVLILEEESISWKKKPFRKYKKRSKSKSRPKKENGLERFLPEEKEIKFEPHPLKFMSKKLICPFCKKRVMEDPYVANIYKCNNVSCENDDPGPEENFLSM